MVSDFSRIITLLRKEKGVTQKQAAEDLGVSQALLSHYEKGIRECGLEFVVRVADYYGVSCDYLLGRSADRSGLTLSVEDIPSPEGAKDGVFRGSVLPTFNKKLISNSLNILYDKLNACPDKGLVGEISGYLMLAVYKMFRLVYGAGPKNTSSMFGVKKNLYGGYSDAAMHIAESNVKAILAGEDIGLGAPLKDTSAFAMTTESLSRDYPLYATSLLNLIKTSEARIEKENKLFYHSMNFSSESRHFVAAFYALLATRKTAGMRWTQLRQRGRPAFYLRAAIASRHAPQMFRP